MKYCLVVIVNLWIVFGGMAQRNRMTNAALFDALNGTYTPPIVNRNAPLEVIYSPFIVVADFVRIQSEANNVVANPREYGVLDLNKLRAIAELATMKYRRHAEFLPLEGAFNATFIRPNLSINPKGVTSYPTPKIDGQLRYRLSR